ncbi:MAG: ribosome assembly RNA-binding protein YhbY [Desulfofustis sp.]|nr:ribosome assembly RNA-binding protein YhbY [Desulfofustis sp.]NNF47927.1 ribosome assembly RNA-binding protein YhbY [Desulfofustis sp.]
MTNEIQPLSNAQKKFLRKLGHALSPVVYIGKEGLSETVVVAIDEALEYHELIKIKIINTDKISKQEAADRVPELSKGHLVQLIGKTLLVYRRNKNKKRDDQIPLPKK